MRNQGSITVEACMVMTVMMFVTFWIIFLSCYLMDIQRIQATITEAAWQGQQSVEQQTNIEEGIIEWRNWGSRSLLWRLTEDWSEEEEQLAEYVGEQLEGKLWFRNEVRIESEIESDRISVSYEGEYRFPIKLFGIAGAENGGIPIYGRVELKGMEAEELARLVRGILRGGANLFIK